MPGTFVYSPAAGTKPEVGTQTLSVTFTPQDTTHYAPSTTVRTLTVNKAEPPVRWDLPAAVLQGSALTPAQVSTTPYALYGIQGTVDPASYTTADGAPLSAATTSTAGSVILQATFVPKDSAHYRSALVSTVLTIKPAATAAAINFGSAKQTIQGFGGSAAWYYTKMADDRLNALFGTSLTDSLGLSILRLRIAPAEWNTATQTADTTQWTAELENGAAAQARGALVFASPWTPPASMKIVNTDRTNPLYSGRLGTFGLILYIERCWRYQSTPKHRKRPVRNCARSGLTAQKLRRPANGADTARHLRVSSGKTPWQLFGRAHAAGNPSYLALKYRIRLTAPCQPANERGDSGGSTRRWRTIRTTAKTKNAVSALGMSGIAPLKPQAPTSVSWHWRKKLYAVGRMAETFSRPPDEPLLLRGAEYVRMSTEHQQYSTQNQADKIREYAQRRGIQIVRTYADEGKSGLRLDGRQALQQLIKDVESGTADFQVILVYDVSRWGRLEFVDAPCLVANDDEGYPPLPEKPCSYAGDPAGSRPCLG
ncbi:hypothetical protein VZ52_09580 [Ralstonia mannitolilytica]|nr:hypothetical protein VZ52_09580 [Ralstonia mannitolilytica]